MSHTKLKDVAGTLVRADIRAHDTRKLVIHRLLGERDRLKAESDDGLAGCLHAAAVLVRSAEHVDEEISQHLQKATLHLVRLVASTLKAQHEVKVKEAERNMNELALGEMLVQLGFVKKEDVEEAVKDSKGPGLGETLIRQGKIDREDVERATALQKKLAGRLRTAEDEADEKLVRVRLGDLLLRNGVITKEQLDEGLLRQGETGTRLGEALVELGYATWSEITEAVLEQEKHGGSTEALGETILKFD